MAEQLQELLQRIDEALTARVELEPSERERLLRWRREIQLSIADARRAQWGD